jgi:hypothetical protein
MYELKNPLNVQMCLILRGYLNLNWLTCRILLLGIFVLLVASLPTASAPPCLVQSVNYDFPSSIAIGQQITAKTHLTATCVQWPPYAAAYGIRVDLTDISTGFVLSTTTYQVGYTQTYIDEVFLNTAIAPNSPGTWSLKVDVYIWESGQLLNHLVDYAKLPVG